MNARLDERADALRWVEEFVAEIDDEALERIARAMFDDIIAGIPELTEIADVQADLLVGVRESARTFLTWVARDPCPEPEVPVAGLQFTRVFVRLGAPMSMLLKVYRLGSAALWRRLLIDVEQRIDDDALRPQVLDLLWGRLVTWIEAYTQRQTDLYDEERDRWLRGALARRVEMVHALLAGEERNADRAGRVLAFELQRHQTALVVWVDEDAPPDGIAEIDAAVLSCAAALGAQRALTVAPGSRSAWAWVGGDEPPDTSVLATLAAIPGDAGIRVAVGRPGFGLQGFRESHMEARAAQRIAAMDRRRSVLTRYEDVEVVALLSQDEQAMRRLVRRELGPLAAGDEATGRLRDTACAFFAQGLNARAAAEQLGTHKNTVTYRLHRIEDLLGHPLGERRLQLELALTLVDVFGERALREPDAA